MRAVVIGEFGGTEVLAVEDRPEPVAGPGQLLIDVSAVGVNFRDVYERRGTSSSTVQPPLVPGVEGSGRVRALGEGVEGFALGDRVAWMAAPGSYAEQVVVEAARAVLIPKTLSDEQAAAAMMQGITAEYLCTSCYPVHKGDVVLVQAAAGGVGLLLTQMVGLRGARVLATASSEEKRELVRSYGAEDATDYDDFAGWARERTRGEGVAAVFDGVGKATFDQSLASLRPRGFMVLYGYASGAVRAVDVERLRHGALFLARPTVGHYTTSRAELLKRASAVFGWIADGSVRLTIGGRFRLEDARLAHEALERRQTIGKLLLLPRS